MLRFDSKDAERRFLLFVSERPAVSSLVFVLFLLIYGALIPQSTSRPFQGVSDEFDVIQTAITLLFWAICLICAVTVALDRLKPGLVAASSLRLVMDVTYSVFVLIIMFSGFVTLAEARENDCNTRPLTAVKDAEKEVYKEAACQRGLSMVIVNLMSTLIIKRIRFDVTLFSMIVGSGITVVFVIVWPFVDPWTLGAVAVLYITSFLMLICFLRYIAEKRERQ